MVSYRLVLALLAVVAASAVVEARVFHDGELSSPAVAAAVHGLTCSALACFTLFGRRWQLCQKCRFINVFKLLSCGLEMSRTRAECHSLLGLTVHAP
jgi:hypothetical protein